MLYEMKNANTLHEQYLVDVETVPEGIPVSRKNNQSPVQTVNYQKPKMEREMKMGRHGTKFDDKNLGRSSA